MYQKHVSTSIRFDNDHFSSVFRFKNDISLLKSFKCQCATGFLGVFCETIVDQNQFLFLHENSQLLFDRNGQLNSNAKLDEGIEVFGSCSTFLNGEALIFGGRYGFYRQVWHFIF